MRLLRKPLPGLESPNCVAADSDARPYIRFIGRAVAVMLALVAGAASGRADSGATGAIISEFMAANDSTLTNSLGRADDWIELHNNSASPIDLGGWHLTDNANDLAKWQIPSVLLPPDAYLVIWASGENTVTNGEIHTSFRLSADGEYLALVRPDGLTVEHDYAPEFPEQDGDISYGVEFLSGAQHKRYFAVPTPGAPNSDAFVDFVADTRFSVERGFHSSSFTVAITCETPGAEIRYTLDGSTPTEVHGTIYSGPIPVNTTTTLRALAYKTGWRSSDVDTQTYIFVEDVLNQSSAQPGWPSAWVGNVTFDAGGVTWSDYEMDPEVVYAPRHLANDVRSALTNIPTLSLVTDLDHLFDPDTGIYVNPRQDGVAWERPVSAEWIHPDGAEGFQVNCGLRIQGGGSRGPNSTPKHSLSLRFKGIYGPARLDYPMFADSSVDSFDTIHLRAVYNNAWTKKEGDQRARAQENQDQFARDLQLAMGQQSVHGNLCHLYINGLYWGLYHPGERPDASWAASHFGGDKEDWDALNAGTPVDGDAVAWNELWTRAIEDLTDYQNYTNFIALCDVTSLIDYMLVMHYVDIRDWDNKNTYAVRRRQPGEKFKFIAWDSERSLESPTGTSAFSVNNSKRPSGLFQRAKNSPEFQLQFADRIHKHFFNGGALTPSRAAGIWRQRSDVIDTVIAAESARWGDFRQERGETSTVYTLAGHYFPVQASLLNNYFPTRSAFMLNEYISRGLYPSLAAPEFGQHGGTFTNSRTVTLTGPATIYYTLDGSDPREAGTGNVLGTQYSGPIVLTHSTRVRARCFNGGTWSALLEADFFDLAPSPLRISELMYAPRPPVGDELAVSSDPEAFAFIELHNAGTNTMGLVGVSFIDGIRFDFSRSSTLTIAPGDYVVVVKNPAAFAARCPSVSAAKIIGEFQGNLAKNGESLKLAVQGVGTVVSFEYRGGRGWPLPAESAGHSLVPRFMDDQSSDRLSHGGNWKPSVNVDGSPGAPEPNPYPCISLNEIAAHTDFNDPGHPDYDSNDWIELVNCSGSAMSLDGYYLSDDPSNLKQWAIPSGINLGAGQRIVFDEVTGFHSPITNGFGIDKAGEQVLLSYAPGDGPASVVDFVQFKGQENGRTLGRYPDASGEWFACVPTPGTANFRAGQEPVISEIMYHPPEIIPGADNTAHEYVEIHNPTSSDVNLWAMDGGSNVGPWRVTGQVEYTFPDSTVLGSGSRVLVVPFNPATDFAAKAGFMAHYGLQEPVSLFGPFDGKLSNQGGRVALEKPMAPDQPGDNVAWVIVDEAYYFDKFPWTPEADGAGHSLQRSSASGAGRDPASWTAAEPTPLSGPPGSPDLILGISRSSGQLKLGFELLPGFSYWIEMKTNSFANDWVPYATVTNPATEHTINLPPGDSPVIFRLRRDP